VKNFPHLMRAAKGKLGNDLVVQTPYGDSGHTTFFIKSERITQVRPGDRGARRSARS
jgi:hypothetical protein